MIRLIVNWIKHGSLDTRDSLTAHVMSDVKLEETHLWSSSPILVEILQKYAIIVNTREWGPLEGQEGVSADLVIISYPIFCCNPRNPLLVRSAWTFLQLNTWSEISAWLGMSWQRNQPLILAQPVGQRQS